SRRRHTISKRDWSSDVCSSDLNDKFYIPAIAYRKNYEWDQHDIIISSIDTAKRSPHHDKILEIDYDFLLVDEAHKLKNNKTMNYSFVQARSEERRVGKEREYM